MSDTEKQGSYERGGGRENRRGKREEGEKGVNDGFW